MKEELITFDTAKLAKEKGLKLGSRKSYVRYKKSYNYDGDPNHRESYKKGDVSLDYDFYMINGENKLGDLSNNVYDLYEAPTQSLLQKWLREVHGINVISDTDITLSWVYKIQSLHPKASYTGKYKSSAYVYSTYEEALEKGLQEALKLI